MILRNKDKIIAIKNELLEKLREENAFWSYAPESVSLSIISDDQLIALTMRHLDLPEIKQLFLIYPKQKIKAAWQNILVPEGEYIYTMNRFFAWYYFDAKQPDTYLKSLQTRQLNKILNIS